MCREAGHVASFQEHAATVARREAGDDVEDRRLARAVGTDEAEDLAIVQGEIHLVDCGYATVALGDGEGFESDRSSQQLGAARRG